MNTSVGKIFTPVNATTREHMNSRISKLWSRRSSVRPGQETAEVPLFMSQTRDMEVPIETTLSPRTYRSHASTRSVIETASNQQRVRPFTMPSSSVYSQSPRPELSDDDTTQNDFSASSSGFDKDLESNFEKHDFHADKKTHGKRRHRRVSRATLRQIQFKARLSLAFGITLLAALIVCELNFPDLPNASNQP